MLMLENEGRKKSLPLSPKVSLESWSNSIARKALYLACGLSELDLQHPIVSLSPIIPPQRRYKP